MWKISSKYYLSVSVVAASWGIGSSPRRAAMAVPALIVPRKGEREADVTSSFSTHSPPFPRRPRPLHPLGTRRGLVRVLCLQERLGHGARGRKEENNLLGLEVLLLLGPFFNFFFSLLSPLSLLLSPPFDEPLRAPELRQPCLRG